MVPNTSLWRQELRKLIEGMLPILSDRFILLVECSEGTRFHNTKDLLVQILSEHYLEHMGNLHQEFLDSRFADIIAEQVILGIITILRKYKDKNTRTKLLTEHLLYHLIGSMGLVNQ